ncbi:MAG: PD-(D/E)XK nuclease family protein [Actinobacteria bacterium]|nr:PD-(D/E)XK nuclease family protein [Actinomycetota bacterium]
MKLSYSSISAYQKCPLSYKFQYVDKLPTKKTPALSFGGSIHQALHFMYNVPTPDPPTLEAVLNALVEKWESDGYADEIEERNHLEHARRVVEQFYLTNVGSFSLPVVLEHKFFIDVDGVTLVGVIDRIDKLPSGGYEIIDYKTNRRLPAISHVEKDLQLSIYHLAVERIWGISPEKLSLYFLLPNQKMSSSRSPEELGKTKDAIFSVAEGITVEKFPAVENPLCPWCDFKPHCPYFRHQLPPADETGTVAGEIDIRALVDEYIEINRRIKEETARLEKLKGEIHIYCESHNLSRVFGAGGYVTRREQKRYAYDIKHLKELLDPVGLWEQVLKVDPKALNQLLASPEISNELKSLVETAREVENISYALYVDETTKTEAN